MRILAPIVLFTYNRPWHTQQTIEALQKNELAKESELFIYCDGAKNDETVEKVNEVREYSKSIDGFKKITIIQRDRNWGLADSIIDGVTSLVNQYGKIIVLEDDIVTSPYFLKFMNDALDFYEDEENIWHISGWQYPIESDCSHDTFAWRMMNCWGWATWSDRWSFYKKNPFELIQKLSKYDKYRFDLDGIGNFWSQVENNNAGLLNTWAIFWYATIFQKNGLCINPAQSFVENIGFDGSGTNTGYRDNYARILNQKENFDFTDNIYEDIQALNLTKEFLLEDENIHYNCAKFVLQILNQLDEIQIGKDEKYIIYGAGNICKLILPHINNKVLFIVDQDSSKINKKLFSVPIEDLNILRKKSNIKILITVVGREKKIEDFLIANYSIDKSRIKYINFFSQ